MNGASLDHEQNELRKMSKTSLDHKQKTSFEQENYKNGTNITKTK